MADATGAREVFINAAEFTDVGSVFNKFATDHPALERYRASALFAINSEFARPDSPVHDGDEIAFFPPVSGG